jgi:hypothetical protein
MSGDLEFVASRSFRAERFRDHGMCSAASVHRELLAKVKAALITIAGGRESRCVTADDAARWMIEQGLCPGALGNASGSLFRGPEWELVSYCPSERASRRRNRLGVWRLK